MLIFVVPQMQTETYILNLLRTHNCVIVPGFGGFIGEAMPSYINRSESLLFPPFKQIIFNSNLKNNDGLLANEIALTEKISFQEAVQKIASIVAGWNQSLKEGIRIELGDLGFLYAQNGKVVFEQNREVNLLLSSYGLKSVHFTNFSQKAETSLREKIQEEKPVNKESVSVKPVIKEEKKLAEKPKEKPTKKSAVVIELSPDESISEVKVDEHEQKIIPIHQTKKRNYKYAIAAAVIIPAAFYSYWIPMQTDFLNTGKIQVSDFNPFSKNHSSLYKKRETQFVPFEMEGLKTLEEIKSTLPENVAVYSLELQEDLYVSVDLEREQIASQPTGNIHLIAGCFSSKSNAENFVNELASKGFSAQIVDKNNGLHRVSAASYNSLSDAENGKTQLENSGISCWILKP